MTFLYLVGHIEEDEELLLLANSGEFLPLLWKRIDTSGVVGASMEDNNGSIWNLVSELVVATSSIESASVLVVVGEVVDLVATVGEDGVVVAPRWSGEEDGSATAEGVKVRGTDSEGTSAGDGLGGHVSTVSDDVAGIGEGELGSGLGEGWKT